METAGNRRLAKKISWLMKLPQLLRDVSDPERINNLD
jgi:hypothetical protein